MDSMRLKLPLRQGRIDLIDQYLAPVLDRLKGASGMLNLLVQTEGCALTVNENCDTSVRCDMLAALDRLVPTGKDCGDVASSQAAEVKALLYGKSLSLPVSGGRIQHGTWQGVYLCPFGGEASEADVTATFVPALARSFGFTFTANKRASHDLGEELGRAMSEQAGGASGVLLVHEQHTSASLSVAPQGADLEPGMSRIIPEKWNREFFTHTMEGDDDMPGHLKCSLLGCSAPVPLEAGRLAFGPGQRLLMNEHRNTGGWGSGHSRRVCCSLLAAAGPIRGFQCAAAPEESSSASAAVAAREITADVQASLCMQDGLATVLSQDPSVGVAVCSAEGAQALSACGPLSGEHGTCGVAIVGCSKALPVAGGKLLLAPSSGVFLIGAPRACAVAVASCPTDPAAAAL